MENIHLINFKPEQCGRIKEISGGCQARKRLYELGLNKGAQVKMIKNDFGPVILNIYGNKLALGRGIASHILMEM